MKGFVFVFSLAVLVLSTQADTIYVPDDYPTIQEAVDSAAEGDSILIDPGEYDGIYITDGPDNLTILGSGSFTNNPTVVLRNVGGYFGSCIEVNNVSGWEFGHFAMRQTDSYGGSGFDLYYSDNCWVHHLDVIEVAASPGIGLCVSGTEKTVVERCLIRAGNYDVVSCWYTSNTNLTFRNLTVSGNSNGIINRTPSPNWDIRNCLVYDNSGDGIEIHYWLSSYDIQYNNSYGNSGSNYSGFSPDPTNISQDPLLVGGTGWQAYMLMPNSPCIDAGDPTSPLDPDSTIADIGCFYFDQNVPQGEVTIDLEPVNPPIVVPPEGGSFEFTAEISCDSTNFALFDVWTELLLPDGQIMGPLILRQAIYLGAGGLISRDMEMYVSTWAMPGTYEYYGHVGDYPDVIETSDYFTFEKLETDGIPPEGESAYAILSGWGASETIELPTAKASIVADFSFTGSPNPFNPAAILRFTLPASGHTTLTVYDLAGRTVATLLDRNLEVGTHAVRFDGSQLASGIYLAEIKSGSLHSVEQIVLVK